MNEPPTTASKTVPPTTGTTRGPTVMQLGIVVAILAVGLIFTALTSDVTRVSEAGVRLVDDLPHLEAQAGNWQGGPQSGLTEEERRLLPGDTEGARRQYLNNASNDVYCSVVVAGRDVTSIHRPELCLPGQGWVIDREFTEAIPVAQAPGGVLKVMRMNSTRTIHLASGQTARLRSIFLYWFVGKDRLTPHHWQRILWTTRDRVLHNTNHRWAYILIHIPVGLDSPDTAQLETAAMDRGRDFVQAIFPTLMLQD
jgi:Protein of unknown function (DUF3485)